MKRKVAFLVVIGVLTLAVAAMAASPVVKVRVVNVTAYGEDQLQEDAGVAKAATISAAENPQMYPAIESLVFTVGKDNVNYAPDAAVPAGLLKFSGSIGLKEPFEFISIANPDEVGKHDAAIVGRDGKVTYVDEPVVIDYHLRTIATPTGLSVKDGDTLLVFVREAGLIPPRDRETALEHLETYIPGTQQPTGEVMLVDHSDEGGHGGAGKR